MLQENYELFKKKPFSMSTDDKLSEVSRIMTFMYINSYGYYDLKHTLQPLSCENARYIVLYRALLYRIQYIVYRYVHFVTSLTEIVIATF